MTITFMFTALKLSRVYRANILVMSSVTVIHSLQETRTLVSKLAYMTSQVSAPMPWTSRGLVFTEVQTVKRAREMYVEDLNTQARNYEQR